MRSVAWSRPAQLDVAAIDDHYHDVNPDFAYRVGMQAVKAAAFLAEHPEAGQIVSGSRFRKWRVSKTPYLLFYRLEGDTLRVVRLIHAARDRRSLF